MTIRFENHSDNNRDQAVFCADVKDPIVWRVVDPLPLDGFALLATDGPSLQAAWDGGASGIRNAEPFGDFDFSDFAFLRTSRGENGRFAVTNTTRSPGGIAFRLSEGSEPFIAPPPIAYQQRLVLRMPREIRVVLARGAVAGERLDPDTILQEVATFTLHPRRETIVTLHGDLSGGYFASVSAQPL